MFVFNVLALIRTAFAISVAPASSVSVEPLRI
jgi:hypothetical protein